MSSLNSQIVSATKWSVITEVLAKFITPITSMILARLLTPSAFGVVTTLNMIIVFAEIFSDAGFQKYLIQQQYNTKKERDRDANVAFWTNLSISLFLWGVIAFFAEPLAILVGNPGLGLALSLSCVSIPLAAFSSIQMALFKKDLNFKTLFHLRLVSILVPLIITIPLALCFRNYWALVIGTIIVNFSNAIFLTAKSEWKPKFYFSFDRLQRMFSFCAWAILDSILVWATGYADLFLIGITLNEHFLGLYKTSMVTVGAITGLITASILPVVMPALAKLKTNYAAMCELIYKFQKYTGVFLLPLGCGILVFNKLITIILLGNQWVEAASFIGLWGLMEVIVIVFGRFCTNIYMVVGRPDIAFYSQILHLIVLLPAVYIAVGYGFTYLYWTRSLIRLEGVLVNMFFAFYLIRLLPYKMIFNLMPEIIGCVIFIIEAISLLYIDDSVLSSMIWCAICTLTYFLIIMSFKQDRVIIMRIIFKFNLLSTWVTPFFNINKDAFK